MPRRRKSPQPLDVDVDELAGARALIAVRRLGRLKPGELSEPEPLEPNRDRRERQLERLGDLGGRHPEPPQALDEGDDPGRRSVRNALRGRGAVAKSARALGAPAPQPLAGGALADSGGLGRLRQRPPLLLLDPGDEKTTAVRAGASVSVELHPVSS